MSVNKQPYAVDDNYDVFYIRFKGDKVYHKVEIGNPESLEPVVAFLRGNFTYNERGGIMHLREKLENIEYFTGLKLPKEDNHENDIP